MRRRTVLSLCKRSDLNNDFKLERRMICLSYERIIRVLFLIGTGPACQTTVQQVSLAERPR